MSAELERYISDNSLRLFGLADRKIIDYVLAHTRCARVYQRSLQTSSSQAQAQTHHCRLLSAVSEGVQSSKLPKVRLPT
ncbi:hypothetical protein C8J57DRAFT_518290 [Mycena rebaudengoi]|nr:hypothetical protein C8J57DRAFT_518290 [Mycena rebaudengoi]